MQPSLSTCKNCGNVFTGNYCNNCGEKVFTEHDKSIAHLVEEGFHFVTHFDGKFLTTVKAILLHPGKLSLDYCSGIQKRYFKPLSFFLLLVVLYLLFPIAQGLNMTLGNHVQASYYGNYAREQVLHLMASRHLTEDYVIEHFHAASEKVSKLLLVLIIPVMALWARLLTYKKGRPYFDHFIFSTEMNSLLVLGGFLILPLIVRLLLWVVFFFTKVDFFNDTWVAFILISFIIVYTFFAAKRFYKLSTLQAVLFAALFVFLYAAIVQFVYKFLLFFISLKLVH